MTKNARFWYFWNGSPVKLTLKPLQSLTAASGGRTDEGWHNEIVEFTYDADSGAVVRETLSEGRDCDGYMSDGDVSECPVSSLRAGYAESTEVVYPAWGDPTEQTHRDEYAEAAGY